jgi:hypothetical protein
MQLQLPIFPVSMTHINNNIGFQNIEGTVYYFHGLMPVFSHDEGDMDAFRFITSQLVIGGNVKQIEISRAFGIPYVNVKRSVRTLRKEGPGGFFKKRKGKTAHVLTPTKIKTAQQLLYKGYNASEVGSKIDAKAFTIRKAIQAGRLQRNNDQDIKVEKSEAEAPKTKSQRNIFDSQANMGIGCTRENERILAALGELTEAVPVFTSNIDVKSAGVLLALPALLENGLLQHSDKIFSLPKGYYGMQSIFIMLGFAVLLRIQSIDGIQYCDAGEMGKLIGLDRIPEVKTLRKKLNYLTGENKPEQWSKHLAKMWLEDYPDLAGTLYVDGHERVYHGKQTKLPKRYIAREKLCLRGVTDYWVNDALGQPFFVVSKTVNPGLLSVLREQIVPRLLKDVPNQPDDNELKTNRYSFRFGMVFDREGYSPAFFKEMWQQRISCYTYRKFAQKDWPETEFIETEVVFPNGEKSVMQLAERGVYHGTEKIWYREIRKLTESGHQTALVTTDYYNDTALIAGKMFARWSQENFFKYMMKHFGIDKLIEYQVEKIDETILIVNPRYRELDSQIRSHNGKLSRKKAEYTDLILETNAEEKEIKDYVQRKSKLRETIEGIKVEINNLKTKRKKVGKHVVFSELPESEKFNELKKSGKQFFDTIKMIAYRSETALANILRGFIPKKDETRAIVRQIFMTDADIEHDEEIGVLRVKIHNMTNPRSNRYVGELCKVLNDSQSIFPGAKLRLNYGLVSDEVHGVPEF